MFFSYNEFIVESKVTSFTLPHLHLTPPLAVTPYEFCRDLWHQKTRVPGLLCGVVCVILCLAVSVEHRLVTDRQTQRQLLPALISIARIKTGGPISTMRTSYVLLHKNLSLAVDRFHLC